MTYTALPDDASLLRVGLSWYREDGEDFSSVPKSCALKPVYDKDNDRHAIAMLSQECVQAITGKKSGKLVEADLLNIQRYAQSQWGKNMTTTAFKNLNDGIRMVRGHNIEELPLGVWVGKFKSGLDNASDTVDGAVDTVSNLFKVNWVAVGALGLGIVLAMTGAFRLMR